MMYLQNYDPLGNPIASTLLAALPILVFLYFLALHPQHDAHGRRRLGVSAPLAAGIASLTALVVVAGPLRMPVASALSAYAFGMLSGFLGIIWIVVAAMFLYTMTLITGKFEVVKESMTRISSDRRLQVLLIAFAFGSILEGTCGFGTPVAIAGAMMVGLGFNPFQAAVLNLIANTAPVAYGGVGTPILTLGIVTGLPAEALSAMVTRQLALVAVLIPFWLVATFVFMEGGSWRDVWDVWPAAAVAGVTFAVVELLVSPLPAAFLLTAVIAGIAAVLALLVLLRFWRPSTRFLLRAERDALKEVGPRRRYPYTRRETIAAWAPWAILIACVGLWGVPSFKTWLNGLIPGVTLVAVPAPFLHGLVQRVPPVAPPGAGPEAAVWQANWLSTAGTGVFVAALLSGVWLRLSAAQWREAAVRTARRMRIPVLTIAQVLGLSFLTRYSGLDAVIGLAFTGVGPLYPFFAALLGWLGVFLSGSDTASNALFGSLQLITAQQLRLNTLLIAAANSAGGVMGKMIDAQSITVATAACYENPQEGDAQVGRIFRRVLWHSLALAGIVGAIVMVQAYLLPWIVPSIR
jgi:lactate permease